jgi:membrane protease YdiL (CAAX protease family)
MGDYTPKASHTSFLLAVGIYALVLTIFFIALLIPAMSPFQIVIAYVLMPACLLWLWHRDGNTILDVGLRRRGVWKRSLCIGFLIGLVIPMALILLLILAGSVIIEPAEWQSTSGWQMPMYAIATIAMVASIVKLAFIIPLEEIIFRGLYLKLMRPALGLAGALAVSSLFFSFLHAPGMISDGVWAVPLLIALLSWFVFGCALGISTLRSGGFLWLPIGVHFGYNLGFSSVGILLSILYNAPMELAYRGPVLLTGQTRWSPETGVAGIVLELSILVAVWLATAGIDGATARMRSRLINL